MNDKFYILDGFLFISIIHNKFYQKSSIKILSGISIGSKIFLALIDGLQVDLLLGNDFLLQHYFFHIASALDHFVRRLIPLFLLFFLFPELKLFGFFFLPQQILLFLVIFDFFFDLCDEMGIAFFFAFDGEPQPFDFVFDFLDKRVSTVMAFFIIFSLLPSIFQLLVF